MKTRTILVIALCTSFNIAAGAIVSAFKLPIYLDAIGTIVATLLLGFRAGAISGAMSFAIGGALLNPVLPWFIGTQIAVAGTVHGLARLKLLRTLPLRVLSGIILGIVAAIVSAPMIVWLFGGITGSGPSVVVAFLLSTGTRLMDAVILSGLTSEPIDKTLQLLIAIATIKAIPRGLRDSFEAPALSENNL